MGYAVESSDLSVFRCATLAALAPVFGSTGTRVHDARCHREVKTTWFSGAAELYINTHARRVRVYKQATAYVVATPNTDLHVRDVTHTLSVVATIKRRHDGGSALLCDRWR